MEQVEAHTMRLFGTVPAGTMKSGANMFRPGDVLYGRLRSYLNKVYQPDFSGLCSGEFIVLPETCAAQGKFLKYRLHAGDFVRFASRINTGDRPRVDFDQIKAFHLSLPPRREQERISDALDELLSDLDAGVTAVERVRDKLKLYRAVVLKAAVEGALTVEWREQHTQTEPASELLKRILAERRRRWEEEQLRKFEETGREPPTNWKAKYKEPVAPDTTDLPPLPDGWCWASFDQIGETQGGLQKSPSRKPIKNHYPYLRVANVHRGSLDLKELHRFELTEDELERLRLEPGDLLIVEGNGSRTEIGRCALWRGEVQDCVHQNHIIRVRPVQSIVPKYADLFMNSPTGQLAIQHVASSTSGLYTLSVVKIERLPLALPPEAEQEAIVEAVEDQLSVIDHLEVDMDAKLKNAQALRQSILRRAFGGELVPQDPHDEPAFELLKRIAAEREQRAREAAAAKRLNGHKLRGAAKRGRRATRATIEKKETGHGRIADR
jgi:type I restriction enzyme, S subunit